MYARVEYLFYYIIMISLHIILNTTVSVATYDIGMPSISDEIFVWNIDLYSTPMDQSDGLILRAYVIIYQKVR